MYLGNNAFLDQCLYKLSLTKLPPKHEFIFCHSNSTHPALLVQLLIVVRPSKLNMILVWLTVQQKWEIMLMKYSPMNGYYRMNLSACIARSHSVELLLEKLLNSYTENSYICIASFCRFIWIVNLLCVLFEMGKIIHLHLYNIGILFFEQRHERKSKNCFCIVGMPCESIRVQWIPESGCSEYEKIDGH